MQGILGRVRDVLGFGVIWGVVWMAVGFAVATMAGVVDPGSIDPGEEPHVLAPLIGRAGLICGVLFGALLSIVEARKPLADVHLGRAALWGALVAGPLPLVTGADPTMVALVGPLGAGSAAASIAAFRAWARWRSRLRPGGGIARTL